MPDTDGSGPWAVLAQLARQQGGCTTLWQARALGIHPDQVHRRADAEGWVREHRAVLRMPGVPDGDLPQVWAALLAVADLSAPARADVQPPAAGAPSPTPDDLRRSLEDAVAVTGWTAAHAYGFGGQPPAQVQLLVPASTVVRRQGIRVIRSRRGIAGFWTWSEGQPRCIPLRVLWDCGQLARATAGATTRVADLAVHFDRTRRFAVDELVAAVEEPAAHGLPQQVPPLLRSAVERLRPGFSHSVTESRARRIIVEEAAALGLVATTRPMSIVDERGTIVAEADVAIRALKVDIEIDGPHHDAPSQQASDARRDRRLDRLGWQVVRYRVREIEQDWEAFRRRVRADLRRMSGA